MTAADPSSLTLTVAESGSRHPRISSRRRSRSWLDPRSRRNADLRIAGEAHALHHGVDHGTVGTLRAGRVTWVKVDRLRTGGDAGSGVARKLVRRHGNRRMVLLRQRTVERRLEHRRAPAIQ